MTSMDMSMHMTGMTAATATSGMSMATGMSMSGMNMPSATGMSGMGGTNGMGGMMMGMQDMMMVFFTSAATPLYSASWMPKSQGQYAGTCVFLIVLATLFRGLIALRCNLPVLQAWYGARQHGGILHSDSEGDGCCAANGVVERKRRWTVNDALLFACLDTTLAGVSYLLMLAVMTMNVGYFLSVLGGTFLGSFMLGHITGAAAH